MFLAKKVRTHRGNSDARAASSRKRGQDHRRRPGSLRYGVSAKLPDIEDAAGTAMAEALKESTAAPVEEPPVPAESMAQRAPAERLETCEACSGTDFEMHDLERSLTSWILGAFSHVFRCCQQR